MKDQDMSDTDRAIHRARQLLAQPPELLNARDLRLALQQLLDATENLQAATGESNPVL